MQRAARVSEWLPKSASTEGSAGANITPDAVLMLVYESMGRYDRIATENRMNRISPF
jgi:hypothetical protein